MAERTTITLHIPLAALEVDDDDPTIGRYRMTLEEADQFASGLRDQLKPVETREVRGQGSAGMRGFCAPMRGY